LRTLIVNADDFGFTRDVNAGVMEAHRHGILTATTLMANGAAFDDAVRLARAAPTLDVGCHLVLAGGESVDTPARPLPASIPAMIAAVAAGRLDPFAEFDAQIRRILLAGIRPTHLDTHKHTHLLPPVLRAVARLSQKFGIRWVRRPFDFPLEACRAGAPFAVRLASGLAGVLRGRFQRILDYHGCRYTDHFAGFQLTGRLHIRQLARLIETLPNGTTEFMCHPGYCTDELRAARTRLKESRVRELEALCSAEVREAVERGGIRLAGYSGL
jgi:chitin disaccharide deacetylase